MEEAVPLRAVCSARATFHHSEYPGGLHRQVESTDTDRFSLSHGPRPTEFKITAVERSEGAEPERKRDYKGRLRTWPGVVFFIIIVGTAAALITLGGIDASEKTARLARKYEENVAGNRRIKDGLNDSDIIEDDGQIGNPKKYPSMGCELPDYLSKNGQIFARAKNGTEVAVGIKGVNWFGMETGVAVPFGLWENQENGTSAYEVASFLARNKFNSVRLPVSIKSILKDTPPQKDLVNLNSNRALNITTYMSTLKTIIESLAYRHVTVMISLHTLDPKATGGAWYSDELGISEDDYLHAVDLLTKNLCNTKHWNVLGLDLKNEPHECTWGGADPDWLKGAELIGNRMLEGCPNWLAFVEGINGEHSITINGTKSSYYDWWGGGLQKAGTKPVKLLNDDKVVYAPHYYNSAVAPTWYLYGGGKMQADGSMTDYVELDDETLRFNVNATMWEMFGYLTTRKKEAVVLGEFAGLYANDLHPKKTTKRTIDFTIQSALDSGFAGGYMWSLNPESAYQYNPADTRGHFTDGLLALDWLSPHQEFLDGMAALDKVKDLKMFPCFPEKTSS